MAGSSARRLAGNAGQFRPIRLYDRRSHDESRAGTMVRSGGNRMLLAIHRDSLGRGGRLFSSRKI